MKDYHGIKVTPLFSLCDYNIKVNDVCWNKVKMTSCKWIACCHRVGDSTGRLSNYSTTPVINQNNNNNHHHHHNNNSSTMFNTFSGRRSKCSPSISSSDNSTNHHHHHHPHNQSPSNSFSSSGYDWANHSQSSFSSSSIASSGSTFHQHKSSTPKQYSKYYDLPFPHGNNHHLHHHHHHHHGRSKDDSVLALSALSSSFLQLPPPSPSPSAPQSIITLINPFEYLLINCETNTDTNCAQISPEREIIAVSNEYWLAFYSIRDNDCLGTARFPAKCLYWTWINGDTIAVITENYVYHWSLDSGQSSLEYPLFALDEEIKTNQIVNYIVDTFLGSWCALTTLFVNDDGEIGGKIQIFSSSYKLSQCIEAHSCVFVAYRFEGNEYESNLLVAINRERMDLWKLYIIELSTMSNCSIKSRPLKSQQLMLHASRKTSADQIECSTHTSSSDDYDWTPFCDIPTNIACDNDLGLIFILSKYGSFYICDLETGTPFYYDSISPWIDNTAIFSMSYDPKTTCLIVICRKGKVLVIKILLEQLLEHKTVQRMQTNVYERINEKIKTKKSAKNSNSNHSTNQTKQPTSPNGHHRKSKIKNNHYNMRTVSIMVNNETDCIDETTTTTPKTPTILVSKQNCNHPTPSKCIEIIEDLSGSFPSYDGDDHDDDDSDDVEEMTRL